jgi:hypothetical protein
VCLLCGFGATQDGALALGVVRQQGHGVADVDGRRVPDDLGSACNLVSSLVRDAREAFFRLRAPVWVCHALSYAWMSPLGCHAFMSCLDVSTVCHAWMSLLDGTLECHSWMSLLDVTLGWHSWMSLLDGTLVSGRHHLPNMASHRLPLCSALQPPPPLHGYSMCRVRVRALPCPCM